ncbi:MAG: type 4a pilus biogenesis protein PilO [Nevskiaceae bacterium]
MNVQQIVAELNALDPKNPGGWPLYVRVASVVILMAALAGGGYYQFVTPELETLAAEQAKEPGLKQTFETKQRKVAALDALKEQLADMERSFGAMLRQLPSRAEIANLLIDISQTRLANSLEEELFQPQGEQPKEFYAVVPNRIVVHGTYHEMGGFVSGVAALPRIVTIEDVDIKPASGKAGAAGQLRMAAVAKTYRYLDEGELAAAKPKPKPGRRK